LKALIRLSPYKKDKGLYKNEFLKLLNTTERRG